ncbi:hypothetical protein PGT21_022658 [Puccinia graminis f. sp. tritici]|uniref:Uncharacterized protein n=1 Tax=Puccinia graminis f. sp. tritici TaxID=56615 RepID=A0A5B0Q6X7_PUCGR|nr:hypothetical protein PGT21_022658 [Puccinia graminis f. sp. tritici]
MPDFATWAVALDPNKATTESFDGRQCGASSIPKYTTTSTSASHRSIIYRVNVYGSSGHVAVYVVPTTSQILWSQFGGVCIFKTVPSQS